MTDEPSAESGVPGSIPGGAGRTGPPWESQPASFDGFVATARGVLMEPGAFFAAMRRLGGLGPPLLFGTIGLSAAMVITAVYQTVFSGLGVPFLGREAEEMAVGVVALIVWAVVAPIFAVICLFIVSAIYHVLLLLFGGARFPFETTFRVVSYAAGSTGLVHLLPICGSVIGSVWNIVVTIIGLARAHETSSGRAAAAVLVPILVCCVLVVFFFAALIALILAGVRGAGRW